MTLKDSKDGTVSIAIIPLASERLKTGVSSVYSQNKEFLNKKRPFESELIENLDIKHINKKKTNNSRVSNENKVESKQNNIAADINENGVSNKDEDAEENEELKEVIVGKGVANALKVFKKLGVLGKREFVGRYKDKDPVKELEMYPKSKKKIQVELEYRDNKGNFYNNDSNLY